MKNSIRTTQIFAALTALACFLSAAFSLQARQTVPTTTTVTGSSPMIYGQPLNFSATVNPAPPDGESVVFYTNGVPVSASFITNGAADLSISILPVGTYSITALYEGDSTYFPSFSFSPFSQTVTRRR